jgi:hypothetical protein
MLKTSFLYSCLVALGFVRGPACLRRRACCFLRALICYRTPQLGAKAHPGNSRARGKKPSLKIYLWLKAPFYKACDVFVRFMRMISRELAA